MTFATRTRAILAACALLMPVAATAQAPNPSELVTASVRPGWVTESGTYMMALHLRLARGWMTYWRHPGESGIVPRLDTSASGNLAATTLHWPEPRLYLKAGFASIGYMNELVLPIELHPAQLGQPITFDADMHIGVCDDICVPVDLQLALTLEGQGRHDPVIAQALNRRDVSATRAGLNGVTCTMEPEGKNMKLRAAMQLPSMGEQEFVLVEFPNTGLRTRVLPSRRDGNVLTGKALLRAPQGAMIDRSKLRLTVFSEHGSVTHQGCSLSP